MEHAAFIFCLRLDSKPMVLCSKFSVDCGMDHNTNPAVPTLIDTSSSIVSTWSQIKHHSFEVPDLVKILNKKQFLSLLRICPQVTTRRKSDACMGIFVENEDPLTAPGSEECQPRAVPTGP